ncbi:DUF6161 domain-containing protein [Kaistella montana]|uniref:DUF6161 domain-containing protein n=1 Tax=Kaistella montana TaxID=1849733 RepID=A0ABW5K772_9FLAO|nr:DUF6161 domain-containing protein [Kaistella montana]MCQ4035055.1 DUF6161 domain-containing protein [Kaistella montana]
MELKELRKKIKDSSYTEILNTFEITVKLPHIDESYHLVGLYNIYEFFIKQQKDWKAEELLIYENLFRDSINYFDTGVRELDSFINQYIGNSTYGSDSVKYQLNSNVQRYLNPSTNVFTAKAAAVEFLIDLYKRNADYFSPAFNYMVGNSVNFSSKNTITPIILAYEFENRNNSQIFNRRESEKRAFGALKSEISTLANTYQNEVIEFQKKTELDYERYRTNEENRIANSRNILANWLIFQKNNYVEFTKNTNENFQNLFSSTNEEFNNLQNQYSELLKLKEPVQYWRDKATDLKKNANTLMIILGVTSLIFAVFVYFLLWFTPEGLLESLFGGDKSKALRWSFVFLIFVSIFFVVIRALLKYIFSNLHLARDAEEREKLTYLYISLLSKGNITEEERTIVFQSLFSRSETGLLKDDSSPTMPGISSIIEKIK